MIDLVARAWYQAEKKPTDPEWLQLPEGRQDTIRKRCRMVLEGEVRRSECTPGDLMIFEGRHRTVTRLDEAPLHMVVGRCTNKLTTAGGTIRQCRWDEAHTGHCEAGIRLHGVQELRWANVYDCIEVMDLEKPPWKSWSEARLFGNTNIGYLNKTNLQVAGQLCGGMVMDVKTWYVTVTGVDQDLEPLLEELLASTMGTFVCGDRPQQQRHLIDLWREPQPFKLTIPERQNYNMAFSFFDKSLTRFIEAMKKKRLDVERPPVRIYGHFEGWQRWSVQ